MTYTMGAHEAPMHPFRIKPYRIFSRAPRPLSGAISYPENRARVYAQRFWGQPAAMSDDTAAWLNAIRQYLDSPAEARVSPFFGSRIAEIIDRSRREGVSPGDVSFLGAAGVEDSGAAPRTFMLRSEGHIDPALLYYFDAEASISADYAAIYSDTLRANDTVMAQAEGGAPASPAAPRITRIGAGTDMAIDRSGNIVLGGAPNLVAELDREFAARVRATMHRMRRSLQFGILYGMNWWSDRYDFDVTSIPALEPEHWADTAPVRRYSDIAEVSRDFGTPTFMPAMRLSFDIAHGEARIFDQWRREATCQPRGRRSRGWTPFPDLDPSKSLSVARCALLWVDPCQPVREPGMIGDVFAMIERSKEGVSLYPGNQA